ncbi:MAG: fibronectin type III domain-containing protein [Nanoarchaeota archaeon]
MVLLVLSAAVSVQGQEDIEISEVTITDITESSAIVSWKTNIEGDSKVEYGDSLDFSLEATDIELNTVHEIKLSDLASATDYYLNITSCDANCDYSGIYVFVTSEVTKETEDSKEEIQDVIEKITEEQGIQQATVEEALSEIQQAAINLIKKGSVIITKNGIYLTYRVGMQKKLLAKGSAEQKLKSWFVKLEKIEGKIIQLKIGKKIYDMELGETIAVDLDNDNIEDLEVKFHSIPYEEAVTLFYQSVHKVVDLEDGVEYEEEDIFDVDEVMVENVIIDNIDMEENAVETPKKKNNINIIAGAALVMLIMVGGIIYTRKKNKI